jgi:hypothetical protein
MEGYPGSSMPHSSTLTNSSVSSDTCFRPEAEFLDEIQTKVSFLLFTVTSTALLEMSACFFKLMQPLTVSVKEKVGKPDRKSYLPNFLRNPYRNLKSEDSQDNAPKPQLIVRS